MRDEPGASAADVGAEDEAALARRIGAGDPAAEVELCRRFAPRVRLFGLRHLRDEAAAQDLVQEVLLTVLARLRDGTLRDPGRVGSFVLGTCRLTVAGERRGRAHRAALLATFGDVLAPAAPPPPSVDTDRLDRCLERLTPRARAVVALTFFADEPADGIARQLGTSPGNVRVVRHRALGALRECLEAGEVRP